MLFSRKPVSFVTPSHTPRGYVDAAFLGGSVMLKGKYRGVINFVNGLSGLPDRCMWFTNSANEYLSCNVRKKRKLNLVDVLAGVCVIWIHAPLLHVAY